MASKHNEAEAIIKRVSRKHDDEAHGGAWKVAFADFCLALTCLFLVLWVMAARNQERVEEWMRSAGGDMMDEGRGRRIEAMGGPRGSLIERNPLPVGDGGTPHAGRGQAKMRYESPADLQELAKLLTQLSTQAGLAHNVQAVVTPYGLRVMLHDTDKQGMFDRGSAIINERFRGLLRKMGPVFAGMENQMLVVGHTDSLQYANHQDSAFSNWTLSAQRAMAARVQLLGGGMSPDSILQVVGMADRAPLDVEHPSAGVNRRIEMLILTTSQAQSVAAMFGMPEQVAPLMEGVDTALPGRAEISELRSRLRTQKVNMIQSPDNHGRRQERQGES